MSANAVWLGIGFLGQAFFSCRFLVQWVVSERQKRSIIPHAFWYFSLVGGATLLCYAIYKEDPVFIVGQGAGLLIYSRNLYFIWRAKSDDADTPEGTPRGTPKGTPGGTPEG